MNLKKIIKFMYILFSIYIILAVNVTNIDFKDMFFPLAFMWGLYLFFCLGFNINKKNYDKEEEYLISKFLILKNRKLIFIMLTVIVASIVSVKFYTGQTPMSVIESIQNNKSLYYQYQAHHAEQKIAVFTLSKLPYIFMLFYVKIVTFYTLITYLLIKCKKEKIEWFVMMVITFSFIYIGIARGTNFEFFELVLLIIFITLTKRKRKEQVKVISKVILLIAAMTFIFYIGVSSRGVNFNFIISRDVIYDPQGIVSQLSQFITFIIILLFDYFGFGFFYFATYINEIWLSSFSSFLGGFIPKGNVLINGETISNEVRSIIDMGSRWHPDITQNINNYGILGLFLICFLLGMFARYIQVNKEKSTLGYLTLFIILLQMVSYPIGNFVVVSSANKLIIVTLIFYWIWKLIINKKVKIVY